MVKSYKTRKKTIINQKIYKKIIIILCVIVVLPFIILGVFFLFKPLSRPNKSVCNYVLKHVPIGTSWDETINIAEKNEWKIEETNTAYGLRINDKAENVSFASQEVIDLNNTNIRIVGTEAMLIKLGEYYAPFHTAVFAYLAFDKNSQLIEIAIRRDIDAP